MPANPQGDQGMSMLDGVSQCWMLSKDCVVWWDAWAAIGAGASAWIALMALQISLGAVLATIFLGYMTLNLGIAANKASDAAVTLAASEAEVREKRDHDESLILLMRVAGEMSDAQTYVGHIQRQLATEEGRQEFLEDQATREWVLSKWRSICFPNYEACSDRLHYLPIRVAARMARVVGLYGSFDGGIRDLPAPTNAEAPKVLDAFRLISRILLEDLVVIQEACIKAVHELGMSDAEVVAEATQLVAKASN